MLSNVDLPMIGKSCAEHSISSSSREDLANAGLTWLWVARYFVSMMTGKSP